MRPDNPLIVLLLFTLLVLTPIVLNQRNQPPTDSHHSVKLTLYATNEHKLYQLDLEEYLAGVLAAEMPAEFGPEALKAQAVAARTLAIRRLKRNGGKGSVYHAGVDFSDDPNECQAWISPGRLRQKWRGWNYYQYTRKIRRAVAETDGVVMVYHGKLIDALYHSTCGHGTVDAGEVWNCRAPYLVSVPCGFDHHSPKYQEQPVFSWHQMAAALGVPEKTVKKMKIKQKTASGRIGMLAFGKRQMPGTEFRTRLKLNSNNFSWTPVKHGLRFRVTGYGHGVGMCQYGADGMAKQGYRYDAILRHYYRGVGFARLKY